MPFKLLTNLRRLVLPTLFIGLLISGARAQAVQLRFSPKYNGQVIALESPLHAPAGDSLSIHTLRFYVSKIVFWQKNRPVYEEPASFHLIDLEQDKSLAIQFHFPEKTDYDAISFQPGIDSLTNVSGAMGGDLDPTKGMFWTWQSGYINAKIEGWHGRSAARNHQFQLHLGGYLAPNQTCREVRLSVSSIENIQIDLDLAGLLEHVDWENAHEVMSPGKEAVRLSELLAQSFRVHEK